MKLSSTAAVLWVLISAAVCSPAAPVMRDAATNDDLTEKFQKSQSSNPMLNARKEPVEQSADPSKANQPESIIATSDFLSFQGLTTLIPKKALLTVPKNYHDRIRYVPGSKLVPWPEFYSANRGWINTVEVTRAQAQGREALDEKLLERIQKSALVIVATCKAGPISVLPPKEPAEEAETTKKP